MGVAVLDEDPTDEALSEPVRRGRAKGIWG